MFDCRLSDLYCICSRMPCLVEAVNSDTLWQNFFFPGMWCHDPENYFQWHVLQWFAHIFVESHRTVTWTVGAVSEGIALTKQKLYIVMLMWDCVVPGIKGDTGRGHAVMMDGTVWRGRAHRATTGMTNTTQVPISSAPSLAANTHCVRRRTIDYEARTVDETVMPILAVSSPRVSCAPCYVQYVWRCVGMQALPVKLRLRWNVCKKSERNAQLKGVEPWNQS
jgi:hypothetical protein